METNEKNMLPIQEEVKEEKLMSLDELISSYTGTDFTEFCLYVKNGVEKLLPQRNATRLEWKMDAAGEILFACNQRGIKVPGDASMRDLLGD